MNKFYKFLIAGISLLSCPLAAYPATASLPYESAIGDKSTSKIASDWKITDRNGDNTTWTYDGTDDKITAVTGYNAGIKYGYNNNNVADDWAISPGFELQAGKEYSISFWAKEWKGGKEKLNVFIGKSDDADEISETTPVVTYDKTLTSTWTNIKLQYTPEESGVYHVAFQANSEKGQWGIYLRGFKIKENVLTPGAPTDLTATAAADKSLKVSLSWTLPVVDDEGNDLTAQPTAVSVKRNGELIATLPGDAVEYEDTSIEVSGVYEYSVSAWIGETEGLSTTVKTGWVGDLTSQDLPYSENFKDQDFVGYFWTTIDVDGNAKTNSNTSYPPLSYAWCFQSNAMKNAWWAAYYTPRNSEYDEDDWLISAPLNFPGPGKYKVSFKMCMYSGNTLGVLMDVKAGTSATPEGMTIDVAEVEHTWTASQLNPATDGTLFEYEFETETGGTYYIGFHMHAAKVNTERRIQLGAFNCELVEQYESNAINPPYNSAEDADWEPTNSLVFNLEKGYYHATWLTEGEVTASSAVIDTDFHPAVKVLKVESDTESALVSTEPFSSIAITKYDHTPAEPEKSEYVKKEDGNLQFKWTNPDKNVNGTPLYELAGARILCDGNVIAETDECVPGQETQLIVEPADVPAPQADDADETEPVYTLVLHNLSGEKEHVVKKNATTGIHSVETAGEASSRVLYTLQGTQLKDGVTPAPGVYIEVLNGKARKITVK